MIDKINNFEEYVQLALRTKKELPTIKDDLNHAVLGLAGEMGEVIMAYHYHAKANFKEELGDIMWYIAIIYDAIREEEKDMLSKFDEEVPIENLNHKYLNKNDDNTYGLHTLVEQIGEIADIVKKHTVYGNQLNSKKLLEYCIKVKYTIAILIQHYGLGDMETCLISNINKLMIRFKEKFTKEEVNNRDLEGEAKML